MRMFGYPEDAAERWFRDIEQEIATRRHVKTFLMVHRHEGFYELITRFLLVRRLVRNRSLSEQLGWALPLRTEGDPILIELWSKLAEDGGANIKRDEEKLDKLLRKLGSSLAEFKWPNGIVNRFGATKQKD